VTAYSFHRRRDAILSPEFDARGGGVAAPRIGVLALQGDFREHRLVLEGLGAATVEVRTVADLETVAALVIPGGESTTIGKLMRHFGLLGPIRSRAEEGMPVYGTCAGLITLAKDIVEGDQPLLGVMDIVARRNAFGRQVHSFEADVEVPLLGPPPIRAVFIRAPWIESHGTGVELLAVYDGHAVAARQGNLLVTAFHPELTGDTRMHGAFLSMVRVATTKTSASGAAAGNGGVPRKEEVVS
jgi:pyridoxal 5'-phosphate synthase pdxT subunit